MKKSNFIFLLGIVLFYACNQRGLQPETPTSELKTRLELHKFRVNGQLGNVAIDYATRNVTVFVPYNHNLAMTTVQEIESSLRAQVTYNGMEVTHGVMIDFTIPRLFLVQGEDGRTSQWTVRVVRLTIQSINIPNLVGAPVINLATKTIACEFEYGMPRATPVSFVLPSGVSTSISEPLDLVAPVGSFTKTTTFDLKVDGYSEQWMLITIHRVILHETGAIQSPNGERTGWNFQSASYINDMSSPATADIIAYFDVVSGHINAAAGGLNQADYSSVNKTRLVYFNNNAAARTFFETGTLTDAKNFFNMYLPAGSSTNDPMAVRVNGFPVQDEVYVLKLDNGKHVIVYFPIDRVNPPNGYFGFNYRLLE